MQPEKSLRTPLAQVRGLGSAHAGTGHFWLQRVTAVSNLVLVIAFVAVLLRLQGQDHAGVVATVSHPLVALLLLLFVISALAHMRIGMQVIIEDYLHHELRKLLALMVNTFFVIAVGAASVFALLRISFLN